MERREFFAKAGALMMTSMVGASMDGCVHRGAGVGGFDVQGYLSRLDAADQKMMSLPSVFPKGESHQKRDAFVRQAFSSLLLVGSLHDIPEAARSHPAIQERLLRAAPVLDNSLFKAATLVESVPAAQRKEIQRFLQKEERQVKAMRSLMLDYGVQAGVAKSRLIHADRLMDHIQWRMQKQNPSLLLDTHVAKVDRVAASLGISVEQRRTQGQLTLDPLSACRVSSLLDPLAQEPSRESLERDTPPVLEAPKKKRGNVGFILMGIGGALTVGGVVASLVGGTNGIIFGGIFGWTPGSIMLLIGIPLAIFGI